MKRLLFFITFKTSSHIEKHDGIAIEINGVDFDDDEDNKYNDIEFNNYIIELVKLLERNICDI